MNILPHKSWHVRTKKNIARVRKDEAQAAEEEKEKQRRVALAVQEDRTRFLRDRALKRLGVGETSTQDQDDDEEQVPTVPDAPLTLAEAKDLTQQNGHINFFQEIEEGTGLSGSSNKEHEEEKKKEQEDYEKKIGYLVYLGQNSLEHSKDKPWYERIERSASTSSGDTAKDKELADLKLAKLKDFQDPLKDIRKYLSTPGLKTGEKKPHEKRKQLSEPEPPPPTKKLKKEKKRHKKHKKHSSKHKKHHSSSSSDSDDSDTAAEQLKKQKLEKLRAERLERERLERKKAEKLLQQINNPNGDKTSPERELREPQAKHPRDRQLFPINKQKYNSQFNPHLARQNFDS